jgi:hypothetical protein
MKSNLVGPVGIEPTTCGLKGSVSFDFSGGLLPFGTRVKLRRNSQVRCLFAVQKSVECRVKLERVQGLSPASVVE